MAGDWETICKVSFQAGDENFPAGHPLNHCEDFNMIRTQLVLFENCYKNNYDELRFEYIVKYHAFGGQTNWWEIQGRYTDPTKVTLYAKSKL